MLLLYLGNVDSCLQQINYSNRNKCIITSMIFVSGWRSILEWWWVTSTTSLCAVHIINIKMVTWTPQSYVFMMWAKRILSERQGTKCQHSSEPLTAHVAHELHMYVIRIAMKMVSSYLIVVRLAEREIGRPKNLVVVAGYCFMCGIYHYIRCWINMLTFCHLKYF